MSIPVMAAERNKQNLTITRKKFALLLIKSFALICVVFVVNKHNKRPLLPGVNIVTCFADSSNKLNTNNRYNRLGSDEVANLFAASGQLRHRLVARSELFNDKFGLRTDGTDALRSLSNQYDNDDGSNDDGDEAPPSSYPSDQIMPLWTGAGAGLTVLRNEIYLLEDKDYPKSLFEDYPRRVGQVSGITTLPGNDVAIFHRSNRHWTAATFNESSKQIRQTTPAQIGGHDDNLIRNDTIMIIDGENGGSVASFGANLFYLPHSIASDHMGNLWVSDVARHQVMRLPASSIAAMYEQQSSKGNGDTIRGNRNNKSAVLEAAAIGRQIWPDIVLGEAFVPGSDESHFCQPSEIAVSSNGLLVFIADGYCNGRVMVLTGAGKYLASFGEQHNMTVVHSLALIEERNLLCVADRENSRILCYNAGLDGNLMQLGQLVHQVNYPLGRVFAITSLSEDHLLVSSNQLGTNRYDLAILNPFTNELKLVWISSDLLEPHSLTSTRDRQAAYAADISEGAYKKVFKFNIIRRRD